MDGFHLLLEILGRSFDTIWSYNLVTVSGQHIRVGNIALAIFLFMAGLKYSKNITNLIKSFVRNKLGADKDAANALEKLIIYIFFCLYIITLLEIANIPLNTFAFVGGALAIAVGFGAQNILNNFISSLILMIERPIKIGDYVEIAGIAGVVISIGARCIIIRNFSKVEILIPNSKLMQNTLVNWTFSDNNIKLKMEITIFKKPNEEFNYHQFIGEVKELTKSFDFINLHIEPEIYLSQISQESFLFLVLLSCNVTKIGSIEYIKNKLNIALLDNFKSLDFKVEYPRLVEANPLEEA